eukprot:TRINITY_DN1568_c0_g1_i2.p1 TRINITY_DN1568_c0_g1~~TRINITY_DN1568_c0_g1_i2.p1  ORF type:complete len:827 (-),score=-17.04 TRINITY_DN1568_c0_g1_i2:629-3109(-)
MRKATSSSLAAGMRAFRSRDLALAKRKQASMHSTPIVPDKNKEFLGMSNLFPLAFASDLADVELWRLETQPRGCLSTYGVLHGKHLLRFPGDQTSDFILANYPGVFLRPVSTLLPTPGDDNAGIPFFRELVAAAALRSFHLHDPDAVVAFSGNRVSWRDHRLSYQSEGSMPTDNLMILHACRVEVDTSISRTNPLLSLVPRTVCFHSLDVFAMASRLGKPYLDHLRMPYSRIVTGSTGIVHPVLALRTDVTVDSHALDHFPGAVAQESIQAYYKRCWDIALTKNQFFIETPAGVLPAQDAHSFGPATTGARRVQVTAGMCYPTLRQLIISRATDHLSSSPLLRTLGISFRDGAKTPLLFRAAATCATSHSKVDFAMPSESDKLDGTAVPEGDVQMEVPDGAVRHRVIIFPLQIEGQTLGPMSKDAMFVASRLRAQLIISSFAELEQHLEKNSGALTTVIVGIPSSILDASPEELDIHQVALLHGALVETVRLCKQKVWRGRIGPSPLAHRLIQKREQDSTVSISWPDFSTCLPEDVRSQALLLVSYHVTRRSMLEPAVCSAVAMLVGPNLPFRTVNLSCFSPVDGLDPMWARNALVAMVRSLTRHDTSVIPHLVITRHDRWRYSEAMGISAAVKVLKQYPVLVFGYHEFCSPLRIVSPLDASGNPIAIGPSDDLSEAWKRAKSWGGDRRASFCEAKPFTVTARRFNPSIFRSDEVSDSCIVVQPHVSMISTPRTTSFYSSPLPGVKVRPPSECDLQAFFSSLARVNDIRGRVPFPSRCAKQLADYLCVYFPLPYLEEAKACEKGRPLVPCLHPRLHHTARCVLCAN